jgi:hypothetical protein
MSQFGGGVSAHVGRVGVAVLAVEDELCHCDFDMGTVGSNILEI